MPAKRKSSEAATKVKRSKSGTNATAAAPSAELVQKSIDTVRVLCADMVQKANSGHPGAPMGCAPIAYVLFHQFMNYNPANPKWPNRDRFVLSNGHACALLYSILHLTGYDISMDDLKLFRQVDSICPGHPENFATPGIEVATGPLGQGISNAVGLAIAEAHLASVFNKDGYDVVDHYTYVLCGDGCLQEGVSSEAGSLAGHLGLGKLIVVYDDNSITIDGDTALSFTENVLLRYESYGWHTQAVSEVNDIGALKVAIETAKSVTDKPSIIKMKTIIGFGSKKQGLEEVHGAPLGVDDLKHVKTLFGFGENESFVVPTDVAQHWLEKKTQGAEKEEEWVQMFDEYKQSFPELASEFERRLRGELPAGFKNALPRYTPDPKGNGTRKFSQAALTAVTPLIPELMGGSADLTGSNCTVVSCTHDFQKNTHDGRYLRFGVREHGMASICNGLFAHGMIRPFGATFTNFVGYALGAVRLSALSRFGVIYITTHDSIGLGEDGPTHQPIEMLEALRATPNTFVLRPCDGNETSGSYMVALDHAHTPSVLVLSRQNCANLPGTSPEKVYDGGYVVCEEGTNSTLDIVIIGTGSEVQLCVAVAKKLAEQGKRARVVSMPCCELFDLKSPEYQLEVLPNGVPILSVEALTTKGWAKYAHASFGMHTFGVSGPAADAFVKFGFTTDNLTQRALEVIEFFAPHAPLLSPLTRPIFPSVASAH